MTCAGCENLANTETLKTTHDGLTVCGTCETWRAECEARDTLKKGKAERLAYYELVKKHRGEVAAYALRDLASKIYKHAQVKL